MPRPRAAIIAIVFTWIPVGLYLDSLSSIWPQRALGVLTWALLIALLRGESRSVRIQVGAVVAAATCLEYTASPLLHLYTYRLHNVPMFVPPGHGLVYLAALHIAAQASRRPSLTRLVPRVVLVAGGLWAFWGVFLSSRPDTGGALLYLVLVGFLLRGRSPLVYSGAFLVTTVLELIGTSLGNWAWAQYDFLHITTLGNPPSGIAGGYCVLDMIGMAVAMRVASRSATLPEPIPTPAPAPVAV
jgi:hypothetical protein